MLKKSKRSRRKRSDNVPNVSYHFSTAGRQKAMCPHCGYVFPTAERTVETDTTAKLIKVEGFKLDFSTPDDCHSYADLLAYAKSHGYKTGWAYFQARKRGMIA